MIIKIKEKEYEYISEHPGGWNFAPGGHFRFPVEIGPHSCFVKRFERKSMEGISGWQLLLNLKGKNEPNLPALYDIVLEKEDGKDIYYVFFEYLQGDTLDKLIDTRAPIYLEKLVEDLFRAFQSIHIKNYWVTDFSEKNIFCEKSGRFLLVDLQYTHSTSQLPNADMIGDNYYWKLIFNFYREILRQRNLKPDDINGSSINYLQAAFLILRLKCFYHENEEYNSEDLFRKLPATLNESAPLFKDIYTNIFRNSELAILSRDVGQIKSLILETLQNGPPPASENDEIIIEKRSAVSETRQPVIQHFAISNYESNDNGTYFVGNGESFDLNWEVQNASGIELFRNGVLYRTLNNSQKNIALKESSSGIEHGIIYKLTASGSTGESVSETLRIYIKRAPNNEPVIGDFVVVNNAEKNGDEYQVNSGEYFNLSWKVKNADSLQLYKNGCFYQTLSNDDESIELTEVFDETEKKIEYTLRASNEHALTISDPINIFVKKRVDPLPEAIAFKTDKDIAKNLKPYPLAESNSFDETKSGPFVIGPEANAVATALNWAPYLKIACIILGAGLIYFLTRWVIVNFRHPDTIVEKIEPLNLYEDSSIIIYGEKFSDSKTIEVLFNDSKGKILSSADDSLVVAIPHLGNKIPATGYIPVTVKANGYDIFLRDFQLVDKHAAGVRKVSTVNFYTDSTITVYCNNLNDSGKIKVYFNYTRGKIKYQSGDSLIVTVPDTIISDSTLKGITLNVKDGIKTVYTSTFSPR
ncbi:MAG: IPT/TIG domain-containing protein [Ferruginibacter sp.]